MIRRMLRELWRQVWAHKWHVVAAPAMVIVFTVLHESAHAAAVVLQGGRVLEFHVLPSGNNWGFMAYRFPAGASFSSGAISLAPYVMWLGCMGVVTLVMLLPRRWPFGVASTLFVWGYVGPWLDIVNAWLPWLGGMDNDLMAAFGRAGVVDRVWLGVAGLIVAAVGYVVHRRLYRENALSLQLYGVLTLVTGAAAGLLLL